MDEQIIEEVVLTRRQGSLFGSIFNSPAFRLFFGAAVVITLVILAASVGARADEHDAAAKLRLTQAGLESPREFIRGAKSDAWRKTSSQILDKLVREGFEDLEAAGDTALAEQLAHEWNANYVGQLEAIALGLPLDTSKNLGDHPPLSMWVENYYKLLAARTRGMIRQVRIIEDLHKMNFALAVVFHPKGSWQAEYVGKEWIEYRRHFIPMANIITYWGSYFGCRYVTVKVPELKQMKRYCKKIAGKLEWAMGQYVAPKLSDAVFKRANRRAKDVEEFENTDALESYLFDAADSVQAELND